MASSRARFDRVPSTIKKNSRRDCFRTCGFNPEIVQRGYCYTGVLQRRNRFLLDLSLSSQAASFKQKRSPATVNQTPTANRNLAQWLHVVDSLQNTTVSSATHSTLQTLSWRVAKNSLMFGDKWLVCFTSDLVSIEKEMRNRRQTYIGSL
ncbi:uncharacterized protein LOC110816400 [Carica papaya]|uniref:uncharacterized protein LOC110816400 n=1 Tax=Carica papaya TaxID=3649 RepID=UPI000B8D06CD|nr:uncharacterized protein LOC110816400 [Carica papaya]